MPWSCVAFVPTVVLFAGLRGIYADEVASFISQALLDSALYWAEPATHLWRTRKPDKRARVAPSGGNNRRGRNPVD